MDWSYDAWKSGEPYNWQDAGRGHTIYDTMDFHVDLGCGKVKKGRIGVDMMPAPGVNVVMDLDSLLVFGVAEEPNRDAVDFLPNGHHRYYTGRTSVGAQRYWDYEPLPGIEYVATGWPGLPFAANEIESIISHHCLEHVRNLVGLMEEVYRVLKPGGIFYPITPLFPSRTAVEDPLHVRYFMEGSWQTWCGGVGEGEHWYESFAVPPFRARFEKLHQDITPPVPIHEQWGPTDAREIRCVLRAIK